MSAASHSRATICTASGLEFDPFSPRPDDVRLGDIAHALSNINRFCGHTTQPYSVAQHSCLVAQLVARSGAPNRAIIYGLLHDAPEAYIGDMAGPLKRDSRLSGYNTMENEIMISILDHFSIDPDDDDIIAVKAADRMALEAERRDLMPACDWWGSCSVPVHRIEAMPWFDARAEFIRQARVLGLL